MRFESRNSSSRGEAPLNIDGLRQIGDSESISCDYVLLHFDSFLLLTAEILAIVRFAIRDSLLTFSFLISEDFCFVLDFPSDRSIFSTFVGGYKNTAIAEKREENPEIPTH